MTELTSEIAVKLVEQTGNDRGVVEAMFASTGQDVGTMTHEQIEGRINYLMKERHGTPFEHNLFTFQAGPPLFAAFQWVRHRTGWSFSQLSGRYADMGDRMYQRRDPENWFYRGKPGREARYEPDPELAQQARNMMASFKEFAVHVYEELLDMGVHREIAREVLPLATMTTIQATCNARSLMHFLSLRVNSEDNTIPTYPQQEINMVADQMERYFQAAMPLTHKAFVANGRQAP